MSKGHDRTVVSAGKSLDVKTDVPVAPGLIYNGRTNGSCRIGQEIRKTKPRDGSATGHAPCTKYRSGWMNALPSLAQFRKAVNGRGAGSDMAVS